MKERLIFELRLNILRISDSTVLQTFLNITVNIGCTFVIFHSHKSTGSTNQPEVQIRVIELAATLAAPTKKKYNKF